jgi:two-component system, NarL family, sensor histidine kinase DesK
MERERGTVPAAQDQLGPGATVALFAFLLFLGFPIRVVLREPPGTVHAVLVLAAVAVFVALYLRVMLAPRTPRDTTASLAVMAAIALALGLDDTTEWAPLFIYVSAAAGFRLPGRASSAWVVAAVAAAALIGVLGDYAWDDALAFAIYALAIGALLRGYARLLELNRELLAARGELARLAVGEERLRFARDLHDLLGHTLSVITLKSELARRIVAQDPGRAEHELREIEDVSREALVEVREAVGGYRRMTLAGELRGARAALDAAGIAAEVSAPEATLPPDVETVLAWAVREGTTNVIRHSRARHCAIRVRAGLAAAGVEILDDGSGVAAARDGAGSGLAGLEERVRRCAGRIEAGRGPDGGFRLDVVLPVGQ